MRYAVGRSARAVTCSTKRRTPKGVSALSAAIALRSWRLTRKIFAKDTNVPNKRRRRKNDRQALYRNGETTPEAERYPQQRRFFRRILERGSAEVATSRRGYRGAGDVCGRTWESMSGCTGGEYT